MQIETERMKAREATEELIRQLVRDDALRGEFMIMTDDADEGRFVQIACDFEDVGGKDDGCFDLEYCEGEGGSLYHCTTRVAAAEIERVFLEELAGRGDWREGFKWEREDLLVHNGVLSAPRRIGMLGVIVGVVVAIVFMSIGISELLGVLRRPGATFESFVGPGFFVVLASVLLGSGLIEFTKWLKARSGKRELRERTIVAQGRRLRRCLPPGFVFLAFWCVGWNSMVFAALFTKCWTPEGPVNGICGGDVAVFLFPLIGIGMVVFWLWLLCKHLRPSYEVRIAGGTVKEGEPAAFEYRFAGDPERVEGVEFATALDLGFGSGSLGTPPGEVNDTKAFSNPLEIASGRVSLELPCAPDGSYMHPKFYFRAKVVFKHGPSVTSSYRIPL